MGGPASIAPAVGEALSAEGPLLLAQTWALASARILPVLAFTPLLGGQAVSARLRVAVVTLFSAVLALGLAGTQAALPQSVSLVVLAALAVKEFLVGLVLAVMIDLTFQVLVAAGQLIDLQRGASIATVFDPLTRRQVSPVGSFFLQFAIVLFVTLGVHQYLILGIGQSFALVPMSADVSAGVAGRSTALLLVELTAGMLVLAVQLAAPMIAVTLLIDLTLGLANKASPNIQMFFLSLGVKPWIGVAVMGIGLGLTMEIAGNGFRDRFYLIEGWLDALMGGGG